MRLADAVSGGIVVAGATLLFWTASGLPAMPGQRFGPATFPTLIALVMGAAGLVILLRGLWRQRGVALVEVGELAHDRCSQAAVLWLILGTVVVIMAWRVVGFPLLGAGLGGGLMLILGVRPLPALFGSTGAALVVHLVFTRLLLVPLPAGLLRGWL